MDSFTLSPLYRGRPAESRDPLETACYDLLDTLGLDYGRTDHDPAHHIETCHAVEAVLGAPIAKNLFLCNRQKTEFYLLVMPGEKIFKTKFLSAQLGTSRLSFAEEADLMKYLGVTPGSASLLGLMVDRECKVRLVLDRQVLETANFGLHPCRNTSTLSLKMADVTEKLIPALGHAPVIVDLPEGDA